MTYQSKEWRKGDWVRDKTFGLVFQIDLFSTMDGCEDCPIIKNPDRSPLTPEYHRFDPEDLEELGPLDRIVLAL